MILFLTSSPSGPLDGSYQVDGLDDRNGFVNNLRKYWKDRSRCLMVAADPDAYGQNEQMTQFFADTMKRRGFDWECFQLMDGRSEELTREQIHSYDVIFLGGGHVPTQNRFLHKCGLREKLTGYHGIIIGISAGTMNSADVVYAQPELPGEAADAGYQRFLTGLNLTKRMILPHYQMVKEQILDGMRLYEDITYADSYGREFLVLPDGSYLMSVNGVEQVMGEAYRICDGRIIAIKES